MLKYVNGKYVEMTQGEIDKHNQIEEVLPTTEEIEKAKRDIETIALLTELEVI